MAIDFVAGSSHTLAASTSPVSGPPFTLICWALIPSIGNYALLGVGEVASEVDYSFLGTQVTGNKARMVTRDSGGSDAAVTTDAVSTSALAHLAGVATNPTSRAVLLNGGAKGTNATSITPNAPDNLRIAGTPDASVGAYPTAAIAEAVILDIAATDAQIAAHATGVHPAMIWPVANIVFYKDLIRGINRGWGGTLAGTTNGVVAHPPIIYPSMPQSPKAVAAAAASTWVSRSMPRGVHRGVMQGAA